MIDLIGGGPDYAKERPVDGEHQFLAPDNFLAVCIHANIRCGIDVVEDIFINTPVRTDESVSRMTGLWGVARVMTTRTTVGKILGLTSTALAFSPPR